MDDSWAHILENVAQHGQIRTLRTGEVLIREGTVGDEVFLLTSGSLAVTHDTAGIPTVIATIDQPGSVVGEIAPLAGGARTATVAAAESAQVVVLTNDEFHRVLDAHPEWAAELSAGAVRRSEEAELVDLLTSQFCLTDPVAIEVVRAATEWVRLEPGEILAREGDVLDSVSVVIRGGLQATHWDEVESTSLVIGHVGRGQVVGGIRVLGTAEPTPTITAVRSSVLARIPAEVFANLLDSHPRVVIDAGLAMRDHGWGDGRCPHDVAVLAMVVSDRLDQRQLADQLAAELARFSSVEHLWPAKVDATLGSEGIADVSAQDPGAIRLGRLLSEAEMGNDHLLLDVGRATGSWSARALSFADRVLVMVPPAPSADEVRRLSAVLSSCPPAVVRTLVVIHPPSTSVPTETAPLVDALNCMDAIHIRPGEIPRLARTVIGRGSGLVLGGGGARGFAHIGVYRALRESGVSIDVLAGTSIGSMLGAAMADAPSPEELLDLARSKFASVLDYTIPTVSMVKAGRITRSLQERFGERHIEDLWRPFACLSTNLTTSRPHVHRRGALVHALRASSSIPGVMPPVPHHNDLLVDGGILNNLPVDLLRQLTPHGTAVAVDVAPVRGPQARADYGLSLSGWQAAGARRRRSVGAPRLTAVLMRSMIVASQRERDHQITGGLADLYLELDLRGVSMLDFSDVAGVAQRGYEAAMPKLTEWLESLDRPAAEPGL